MNNIEIDLAKQILDAAIQAYNATKQMEVLTQVLSSIRRDKHDSVFNVPGCQYGHNQGGLYPSYINGTASTLKNHMEAAQHLLTRLFEDSTE